LPFGFTGTQVLLLLRKTIASHGHFFQTILLKLLFCGKRSHPLASWPENLSLLMLSKEEKQTKRIPLEIISSGGD